MAVRCVHFFSMNTFRRPDSRCRKGETSNLFLKTHRHVIVSEIKKPRLKDEVRFWTKTRGSTGFLRGYVGCSQSSAKPRTSDSLVVEVVLGRAPFVSVMQTADFGNRNNLAGRLNWPRIW